MGGKKKGWGGKRPGTGRPPDLPYWQAFRVGMICQERFREEQNKQAQERYEAHPVTRRIREQQAIALQKAERAKSRFVRLAKYELARAIAAPSAAIDKLRPDDGLHSEPLRRPKDVREAIKREVVEMLTQAGCRISVQTVDRCWRLARKEEAKLMRDRGRRTKKKQS